MKPGEKKSIISLNKIDKSDCKSFKFGEIAFNISERVDPKDTDAEIYVGLEHLDPDSIHIRRTGVPSDVEGTKLKVYKGDIIFGKRRAYQRKAAIAHFNGICSAHSMVLRANPETIEPDLFPFFIHSDIFMNRAVDISEGSLSPTIKWRTLSEQEFRLPSRPIQKKLAELLLTTDQLEQGILENLNKTEILFNCYLKIIENGNSSWPSQKLKDIIILSYGKGLKESDRVQGNFDVIGSSGICDSHNEYLVKGPGIVIGRKGSVGQITWVTNNFWPIDTTYWVSIKNDLLDQRFLYYLLRSLKLNKLSISTAIPGINRDDILLSKVKIPKKSEQIKIREIIDKILDTRETMSNHLQTTQILKKKLLDNIL